MSDIYSAGLWGDAPPTLSTDDELEARRFDRPASAGARVRAVAGGALDNLTPLMVWRNLDNPAVNDFLLGTPGAPRYGRLSVEELNERYGIEGALSFTEPTTARWAADRWERTQRALWRQDVIQRAGDAGEGNVVADFGVSLGVGVIDPINYIFPFGRLNALRGIAPVSAALASERVLPRMLAHAGVGAVEGAVFSTAVEPLFYGLSALDRQGLGDAAAFEYGLEDSLINIIAGAGVSGVFNGVGGVFDAPSPDVRAARQALPEQVRAARPEQRAAAAAEAVGALAEGRPIESARIFDEPAPRADTDATRGELIDAVLAPPARGPAETQRLREGRDAAAERLRADLAGRYGDDDAVLMGRAIADGFASIGAHYGESAVDVMDAIGLRVMNESAPRPEARTASPAQAPTREELRDLERRATRYANREDAAQRYADAFADVVDAVSRMPDGAKWLARRIEDESDDRRLALYRDVQRELQADGGARYQQGEKKKYLGQRMASEGSDRMAHERAHEALAEFGGELELFAQEFDALRRLDNALPAAISEPIDVVLKILRELRERAPEAAITEQRASRDQLKAFRDEHRDRLAAIRSDGVNADGAPFEATLLHWVDELLAAYDESLNATHTFESALIDGDLDDAPHTNLETAASEYMEAAENTPDEAFAEKLVELVDNLRAPGLGGDEVLAEAAPLLAQLRRNLDEVWDEWQSIYGRRAAELDDRERVRHGRDANNAQAISETDRALTRVDYQLRDLIGAFDGAGMDHGGLRVFSRPVGKRRTFMQSPRITRAAERARQKQVRAADKNIAIAERQAVAFLAAAECFARVGFSDAGGRGASELLAGLALGQAAAIPAGVAVANAINDQTLQNPRNPEQWLERVRREARANLDLDAMGFLDTPVSAGDDGRRFFEGQGWFSAESDPDWSAAGYNDWTPPAEGSATAAVDAAQANGARVPPAPPDAAEAARADEGAALRAAFSPMLEEMADARAQLEAEALIEAFEPLMTPAQRRARRQARRVRQEESAS